MFKNKKFKKIFISCLSILLVILLGVGIAVETSMRARAEVVDGDYAHIDDNSGTYIKKTIIDNGDTVDVQIDLADIRTEKPLDIALVVDCSLTMSTKMEQLRAACKSFATSIATSTSVVRISTIIIGSLSSPYYIVNDCPSALKTPKIQGCISNDFVDLNSHLNTYCNYIDQLTAYAISSSRFDMAISKASDILSTNNGHAKLMVIIGDGACAGNANTGNFAELAEDARNAARHFTNNNGQIVTVRIQTPSASDTNTRGYTLFHDIKTDARYGQVYTCLWDNNWSNSDLSYIEEFFSAIGEQASLMDGNEHFLFDNIHINETINSNYFNYQQDSLKITKRYRTGKTSFSSETYLNTTEYTASTPIASTSDALTFSSKSPGKQGTSVGNCEYIEIHNIKFVSNALMEKVKNGVKQYSGYMYTIKYTLEKKGYVSGVVPVNICEVAGTSQIPTTGVWITERDENNNAFTFTHEIKTGSVPLVPPQYTVSYNANGGNSTPASQTVNYDTPVTLATGITKNSTPSYTNVAYFMRNDGSGSSILQNLPSSNNYTFKNWNTNANGTGTSYNAAQAYTFNTDTTLYAQFNSTQIISPETMPSVSRSGYRFAGWYTAPSGGTYKGTAGTSYSISVTTTYYAHWTPNTIIYHNNDGTNTTSTQTISGSSVTLKALPERDGWVCDGWFVATVNGNEANEATAIHNVRASTQLSMYDSYTNASGRIHLYAHWSENQYSVAYDAGDSTAGTPPTDRTYGLTENYIAPTNIPSMGVSVNNGTLQKVSEVRFYTNGGVIKSSANGGIAANDNYTLSDTDCYSHSCHHTLGGWSTADTDELFTCGTSYDPLPTYIESNTTSFLMSPGWNPYLITTPEPERPGYKFEGWYIYPSLSGPNKAANTDVDVDSSQDFYAKWTPVNYKIIYSANDGTGATQQFDVAFNVNHTIINNPFTNGDKPFIGWCSTADGKGTLYQPSQTVKNLTEENNGIITLYAIWLDIEKTVDKETTKPGDILNYTIKITEPLDGISYTVSDTLPAVLTYNNDANITPTSVSDNTVSWTASTSEAGRSVEYKFSVTVGECARGDIIDNKAVINFLNNTYDTNTVSTNVKYFRVYYDGYYLNEYPEDTTLYSCGDQVTIASGNYTSRRYKFTNAWEYYSTVGERIVFNAGDTFYIPDDCENDIYLNEILFTGIKKVTAIDNELKPGNTLQYSISARVREDTPLMVITDVIPEHTTYVPNSASCKRGTNSVPCEIVYDETSRTITWALANPENASYKFEFQVQLDADTPSEQVISNLAEITYNNKSFKIGKHYESDDPTTITTDKYFKVTYVADDINNPEDIPVDTNYYDPNDIVTVLGGNPLVLNNYMFYGWLANVSGLSPLRANDTFVITDNVTLTADWFQGRKTATKDFGTLKPGQTITYRIRLCPSFWSNGFTLTDKIPEGTEYVEGSATRGGVYSSETNTVTWVYSEVIATIEFRFTVRLKDDATSGGTVENTATFVDNNNYRFIVGKAYGSEEPCIVNIDEFYKLDYDIGSASGTTPGGGYYLTTEPVIVADNEAFSNGDAIFTGWNSSSNGTGTHYDAENEIYLSEDTTLYAKWVTFTKDSVLPSNSNVTTFTPGAQVVYTLNITIPETAEELVISDALPADVTLDTSSLAADYTAEYIESESTIVWTLNNVSANTTVSKSFLVTINNTNASGVAFADGATICNTAIARINNSKEYSSNEDIITLDYYTVKYILNEDETGAVPIDTKPYSSGDTAILKTKGSISKAGYTFIGWSEDDSTIYKEGEVITVNSNVLLHALWAKLEKVSVCTEVVPGASVLYNITVTKPTALTGETFEDILPAGLKAKSVSTMPASCGANLSISEDETTIEGIIDSADILGDTGPYTSYTVVVFAKISSDIAPGTEIDNMAKIVTDNDYTVNSNTDSLQVGYEITYVDGSHEYTDGNYYQNDTDATIISPQDTINNSYFLNWNTKRDGSGTAYSPEDIIKVNSNITLYAMRLNVVKFVHDIQDNYIPGDTVEYIINVSVPYSNSFQLTDIFPVGVTFTDISSASVPSLNSSIVGENEGVLANVSGIEPNNIYSFSLLGVVSSAAVKNSILSNHAIIKFDGVDYETNDADIDIADYYKVTYDANGADGTAPVDETYYRVGDKAVLLSSDGLYKDNYRFSHWNTASDGSADNYSPDDEHAFDEDITLYAIFKSEVDMPETGSYGLIILSLISVLTFAAFIYFRRRSRKTITE